MIDLKKFCSSDQTRPYLMKPFTIGIWTYATNGHICARVPAMAEWPGNTIEAPAPKLFVAPKFFAAPVPEFRPLPKIELPPPNENDECKSCDGRGYEHDCPDCDCTCEKCDGAGIVPSYSHVSVGIGDAIYAGEYIHLMQSLPGVEIGPTLKSEPLRFRFAGGEGCLAPCYARFITHINAGT
jgi:hypothetical protein